MTTKKIPAKMKFNGQPLFAGPDKGFNIIVHAKVGDDASVLGRNEAGTWLFLWCDSGDGWVPAGSVNVSGDANALGVWEKPFKNYTFKPDGTILRESDLKNGPSASYETMVCIPAGQYTKILAQSQDGHWLFIWSDLGDGWMPRSAVESKSDLSYLKVWANAFQGAIYAPMATVKNAHVDLFAQPDWAAEKGGKTSTGKEVKVLARDDSSQWVYIWCDDGDGWVSEKFLNVAGDVAKLSVWVD